MRIATEYRELQIFFEKEAFKQISHHQGWCFRWLKSTWIDFNFKSSLCFFCSYIISKSSHTIHTQRLYFKMSSNHRRLIFVATQRFFVILFPVWGGKERTSCSGLSAHHRGTGGTWGKWGGGGGGRGRGGGGRWGHVCISVIGAEPGGEPQRRGWEVSVEPTQPEDHGTELQEVSEEDPGNYSHHFRPFQPQPQVILNAIDLCLPVWACVSVALWYVYFYHSLAEYMRYKLGMGTFDEIKSHSEPREKIFVWPFVVYITKPHTQIVFCVMSPIGQVEGFQSDT